LTASITNVRRRGYYKEVYSSNLPNNETIVFKHFFWGAKFHYDDFEFMRMDAIVNEKLNGNPRIVKSYGFCGTSFIGESMKNGDLEKLAIPSGVGRIRRQLNDKEHLVVGNNLSGTKKLELSLEMAEAVLLLHSFPGGVIVHDDIQLSQFLISPTGQLKLNDFNRAEIMLWNEKDQEYCKYRNDPGEGDVRFAPNV
jgi:serine/threonine protein kinase